jgi:hypothetical protein
MPSTQAITTTPIVILMGDAPRHTTLTPFCSDPICPCHESSDLLEMVAQMVQEGLLTPAEAARFVAGQPVEEVAR